MKNFTTSAWQTEVLEGGTVLVDFWAPWCGPCRALAPAVEAVATEFEGRLKVGKLNIDDEIQVASQYRVSSIPTLLLFKNGQVVEKLVGAVARKKILDMVQPHLD